jgi:hypothetical protein
LIRLGNVRFAKIKVDILIVRGTLTLVKNFVASIVLTLAERLIFNFNCIEIR